MAENVEREHHQGRPRHRDRAASSSARWETHEGEKRSKVEVVADEVGPSLRWATAQVVKNERRGPGGDSGPADAAGARRRRRRRRRRQGPPYGDDEEPF